MSNIEYYFNMYYLTYICLFIDTFNRNVNAFISVATGVKYISFTVKHLLQNITMSISGHKTSKHTPRIFPYLLNIPSRSSLDTRSVGNLPMNTRLMSSFGSELLVWCVILSLSLASRSSWDRSRPRLSRSRAISDYSTI